MIEQFLQKVLYPRLYLQSLICETVVILAVLLIGYFLSPYIKTKKNRLLVTSLLITALIGIGLGHSQGGRLLLLASCSQDNRVKFEFKAGQPLDQQKVNIAMLGSSQANCAIDEEIVLEELRTQTNTGAVVDLHFPGSTPHSVLETALKYRIAERFDVILYYLTDRDFYTKPAHPVHNLTARKGVSNIAFQIFPDWVASSLRKRIFPEEFHTPQKRVWEQTEDKLILLQDGLSIARQEASSQVVQALISYCETHQTTIVFCLGHSHPTVDPEGRYYQGMHSELLKMISDSAGGFLYLGDLIPEAKDFRDLTHTTPPFQKEYSKALAAYLTHTIESQSE